MIGDLRTSDALTVALESGTDHELALALRDLIARGIVQHSTTAGAPVPEGVALIVANNLAGGIAHMIRSGT